MAELVKLRWRRGSCPSALSCVHLFEADNETAICGQPRRGTQEVRVYEDAPETPDRALCRQCYCKAQGESGGGD